MKNIILTIGCLLIFSPLSHAQDNSVFDFESQIEVRKKEKLVQSPYAMFGDNTAVLQTKHEDEKDHTLKIPIIEDDKQKGLFKLDFQTGIVSVLSADGNVIFSRNLEKKEQARFTSIDPLAERYYSISPYAYVANNPINAIDPRGDSIWFTIDNNIATMHYTAKMINMSSDNLDMSAASNGIMSAIGKAFEGANVSIDGKSYSLNMDIQISAVSSMDDVASSDHLFVMADNGYAGTYGVTNEIGGKVVHLNASGFHNEGVLSKVFGVANNTRSGAHEAGHTFGLEHPNPSDIGYSRANDIMVQGAKGTKFLSGSVQGIYNSWNNGALNKGTNSTTVGGGRAPYQGVRHGGQTGTISTLGFRYKRR